MPSLRKVWITLGLAVVVAGAATLGCRARREVPVHGEGFNVLLISIDTLRADHLGCYGHPVIQTPNIDRLAAEGTQFMQCTAACPLTLPSHATMLTGTYPFVHGARNNENFYVHEDNTTLTEVLKSAGYATAAEIAAYVINRQFGLSQGFDVYHDVPTSKPKGGVVAERPGDEVCTEAIALLKSLANQRFFLFVHFYDPHYPYTPPPAIAEQYDDPYVGEIAHTDAQVGRLLNELKRLGLEEKTLVVLTADHGESRGQHSEVTHGTYVYDSTLAVPLILYCPGKIPAGRRVSAQVRLADIPPTVLAFLGLEPLTDVQGRDLTRLISGAAEDLGLTAYGESLRPYLNWGYAPVRALRRDGWKYIHAPGPQLYHVREDVAEEHNLAAQEPDRVAQFRAELHELIAETPSVVGATDARREATAEELQQLAALGYVGSGEEDVDLPAESELGLLDLAKPDPHDHTDEIELLIWIERHLAMERFDEAERQLRELFDRRSALTDLHWVFKNMGFLLARRESYAEAAEYYRKAIELRPDDATTLGYYAMLLAELGKAAEAVETFERALQIRPVQAQTHENYGVALYRMGRIDEAIAHLQRAVEMEPGTAEMRARLARVYVNTGRLDDAIAELERGIEATPDVAELRTMLDNLRRQAQQAGRARAELEARLERDPEQPALYVQLAELCRKQHRPEEAEQHLQKALKLDPKSTSAWEALAFLQLQQGRPGDAAAVFKTALAADPGNATIANDLAWLLATCPDATVRDGTEALRLAQMARQALGDTKPNILDTLAAALAELGRFDEAVGVMDEAMRLAGEAGNAELVKTLNEHRELYRDRKPYRMKP